MAARRPGGGRGGARRPGQQADRGRLVGAGQAGQRLDRVLQAHPAIGSRSRAQALIAAGAVTVDGRPRPKSHAVELGETVTVTIDDGAAPEPADPSAPHAIAYEDEHLV